MEAFRKPGELTPEFTPAIAINQKYTRPACVAADAFVRPAPLVLSKRRARAVRHYLTAGSSHCAPLRATPDEGVRGYTVH